MNKRYTFEVFAPAFPAKGTKTRVHRGSFEENRDFLNPSMLWTREFEAKDDSQAKFLAKASSIMMGFKFEGITE